MDVDDVRDGGMSQFTTSMRTADDVSSSSVFGTEHHQQSYGIIGFLLHTPRGLAVLLGSGAALIILMFGIFVCLCVKCLRRRKHAPAIVTSTVFSTSSAFVPQPYPTSSSDPSDTNGKSVKSGRMRPHKNIITPDRNIAFVVPTVSFRTFDTHHLFLL